MDMSQNMRQLVRVVCGLLLVAAIGVVVWMANAISRDNIDAFRDWNSLYDYITVGGVVFSCVLLGAMAVTSRGGVRLTLVLLGISLLASGIVGHYAFQYLSRATFVSESVYSRMQLKPNAGETVLGFHYVCPSSGGYVAFGDGSVRYVDREQFATLRHADIPDQPPEFTSPIKEPTADEPRENADEQQDNSELGLALKNESLVQERIKHSSNLKRMAEDHFSFRPRDGIRRPLKPEHFTSYPGMTDELRKAISDGTYIWYFGWDPIDSKYYEEIKASAAAETKALWYDFTSWASIYFAGFGAGSFLAGLTLLIKRPNPTLVERNESA
jgi:hypothetical protein